MEAVEKTPALTSFPSPSLALDLDLMKLDPPFALALVLALGVVVGQAVGLVQGEVQGEEQTQVLILTLMT